ncbi:MAG: EamA family transporter [Ferruginibacter sp.]
MWAELGLTTVPYAAISTKVWLVIIYLAAIGSIVAFVAFIYSMKKLPAAIASLYAYINPLVAMVLGSLIVEEKLTIHILWGSVVTLAGVYLVNMSIRRARQKIIVEPEQ